MRNAGWQRLIPDAEGASLPPSPRLRRDGVRRPERVWSFGLCPSVGGALLLMNELRIAEWYGATLDAEGASLPPSPRLRRDKCDAPKQSSAHRGIEARIIRSKSFNSNF